ncbi:hypothetical protein JFU13_01755 [Peribacillus sp. TH24]|uniref:hypothetical protein n=2 Tax=Peribacillus TaxID=2675229 RepID=UPI001913AD1F|nr:hypothetical protein [Peribacillus sp. TH24]
MPFVHKMFEINLTPEFLDLDIYETMDTLMHEMVHLYNRIHDVQDVSRSGTYKESKLISTAKVSIVACINKLLHWIYALLKRKETFLDLA